MVAGGGATAANRNKNRGSFKGVFRPNGWPDGAENWWGDAPEGGESTGGGEDGGQWWCDGDVGRILGRGLQLFVEEFGGTRGAENREVRSPVDGEENGSNGDRNGRHTAAQQPTTRMGFAQPSGRRERAWGREVGVGEVAGVWGSWWAGRCRRTEASGVAG
ncbi:hypothetical protein CIPAW_16G044900 [Carya illinoinensis]|uniref:Uncharacterized protein n=1 Tax=Carya illinoinensis TaxID=32201 RepID=A0A8T1N1V8_CARIL|nr:hypothetical protein CIPAW_16G044900 [Carya illinoinensis]